MTDIPEGLFVTVKSIVNGLAGLLLFFLTPTGIIVFTAAITLYLVLTIMHALRRYSLTLQAASASQVPGKAGNSPEKKQISTFRYIFENVSIVFIETGKFLGKIISSLPVLLCVLVIFLVIVGTSSLFNSFDQFMKNEERIKEMRTVLKHLDERYKVADMNVIAQDDASTTVKFSFYDYAHLGTAAKTADVTIKGKDIYLDSMMLNFSYSEIGEGNSINIALPYRIFSEEVPQAQGIRLDLNDETGIPIQFRRPSDAIYGLSEENFNSRLKEIISYFTDKEAARKAGVRSIYGNAVHRRVFKGDFLSVWIEQTGGLVIKKEEVF